MTNHVNSMTNVWGYVRCPYLAWSSSKVGRDLIETNYDDDERNLGAHQW